MNTIQHNNNKLELKQTSGLLEVLDAMLTEFNGQKFIFVNSGF